MPVSEDEAIQEVLELSPVAVVGCSRSREKDAHRIPAYLLEHGYEVIPVNPHAEEILGQEAYPSLEEVPSGVQIVDVFRPSEEVPGIVDAVLERDDVTALWLQRGVRHDEAAARAEDAGLRVVQDRCMKVEHTRLA